MGHVLGLNDAYHTYPGVDCTSISSIMRGTDDDVDCNPVVSAIASQDVAQANRHQQNTSQCQTTFPSQPKDANGATPCPQSNNCGTYADPDTCTYGTTNSGCAGDGYLTSGPSGDDCCAGQSSPIIIDVNGDGFDLTDVQNGVHFDFGGVGIKTLISWTAKNSDDAWLVLDRDGNGQIDNASEMFGNLTPQPSTPTPNGFLALGVFDQQKNGGNNDGIIDKKDAVFQRLRLWQDKNHNGLSEADELHTLDELGVVSIGLNYALSKWVDMYGNQFRYRAPIVVATKTRSARWAYDVFLVIKSP